MPSIYIYTENGLNESRIEILKSVNTHRSQHSKTETSSVTTKESACCFFCCCVRVRARLLRFREHQRLSLPGNLSAVLVVQLTSIQWMCKSIKRQIEWNYGGYCYLYTCLLLSYWFNLNKFATIFIHSTALSLCLYVCLCICSRLSVPRLLIQYTLKVSVCLCENVSVVLKLN